jgi:hypothetical protein
VKKVSNAGRVNTRTETALVYFNIFNIWHSLGDSEEAVTSIVQGSRQHNRESNSMHPENNFLALFPKESIQYFYLYSWNDILSWAMSYFE